MSVGVQRTRGDERNKRKDQDKEWIEAGHGERQGLKGESVEREREREGRAKRVDALGG